MSYTFRPMIADDFAMLLVWLQTPHVKAWWNDGDDTLAKVAEHYGDDDGVERYILLADERPIGYFQAYPADEGAFGIDQFIGEADCIGKGIGPQAIGIFAGLLRQKHGPVPIVLDPVPDNHQAIRCYEKAGFVHYATVPGDEPGQLAYMMRLAAPATMAE